MQAFVKKEQMPNKIIAKIQPKFITVITPMAVRDKQEEAKLKLITIITQVNDFHS